MTRRDVAAKRFALFATLMMPLLAVAQDGLPALQHGIYVAKPYPCKGAPNAAIRQWDGKGLSGAHSSQCTTRVLSRTGATYKLSTSCAAMGDGTPDSSGFKDVLTLTRRSMVSFDLIQPTATEQLAFRWCSVKDVD